MNLDDETVSHSLFHPRKEGSDRPGTGIATETAVENARICGYLHVDRSSQSILLFFHGNGEIAADYDGLASFYRGCGASFWVADYRGYGRSTGLPSYSAMLGDAETLFDDIPRIAEENGFKPGRVLVMGRSLGSASAIHLAARRPERVAGLMLDSPYADGPALVRRLGGPAQDLEKHPGFEDNLDKIRRCGTPTLILHGSADRVIPFAEAKALHDASPAKHKHLHEIRNAGHNDLLALAFEEYFAALTRFTSGVANGPAYPPP